MKLNIVTGFSKTIIIKIFQWMGNLIKLYRISKENDSGQIPIFLEDDFKIEIFKPTILKLGLDKSERFKRILWFIITFGQYIILYVIHDNQIAHYSFIIPKNFRFPFMKTNDLQIGPCFTYPGFRKQGIYTKVLKFIPNFFGKTGTTFWIYTTQSNLLSQKAIEKAGYIFVSYMKSTSLFRILKQVKVS